MVEKENSKKEQLRFCPKCSAEGKKSKLEQHPDNFLKCVNCKWKGRKVQKNLTEPFFCPKCALEGIKSELKNYPNHFLVCGNCQFVVKQVGGFLFHTIF